MTPREYQHFLKTIRTLRQRGISIIYISHHMEEIFEICDRITVLRDGKNVATSQISEITLQEVIHQMLGKEVISGRRFVENRNFTGEKVLLELDHVTTGKLKDLSFQLHEGEVLAVTGLLGAGKTELANVIFGEDKLLAGRICVDGREVSIRHPQDAMRCGIALVNEDRKGCGLLQDLSIKQNIAVSNLHQMKTSLGLVDVKKGRDAQQGK